MRGSGGRILIEELVRHGIRRVFGVPGESYLDALDAMHGRNDIDFVICRQEGGAAMMAEAHGKLTGRPGVCFVTRGPGATNASSGVHVAAQDSTPMILLVGQIDSNAREREAFQEVDYRQMFGGMVKWVAEIDDARRIPEFVHRAMLTACSGRPGPVVLALPENMLTEVVETAPGRPCQAVHAFPDPAAVATLLQWLEAAERPLVILGGGGWNAQGIGDIRRFVEANDLATAVVFRRQDYLDNTHPCYVGDLGIGPNPALVERLNEADLVLVIGARLGEMTTNAYTLIDLPQPRQRMVQVLNGAEELGRVYQPDLLINASLPAMAATLAALPPLEARPWAASTRDGHSSYLRHIAPIAIPGDVQMPEIMAAMRERLPAEAFVTNGAGNYSAWCNRFYSYRAFRSQLAPTSGSMGYGLPAAIAAKLEHPDRPVVCFAGVGSISVSYAHRLSDGVQPGDRGQHRARCRQLGQDGEVVPGEVAAEVFGGDAAAAAEEGLEPLVAAVDGVDVEVAAAAFAGFVVERLMGEAQDRAQGGKNGAASVTRSASRLDGAFEVGPDGGGGGVGQHSRERRAAAIRRDQDRHLLLGEAAFVGDAAPLARLAVELFGPFAAGQHIGLVGLDDALQLDTAGLDRGQKAMPPAERGGVRHAAARGRPLDRVAVAEPRRERRPQLLLAQPGQGRAGQRVEGPAATLAAIAPEPVRATTNDRPLGRAMRAAARLADPRLEQRQDARQGRRRGQHPRRLFPLPSRKPVRLGEPCLKVLVLHHRLPQLLAELSKINQA
jgi:acetolactate synthase I/II/III large subunit